MFYFFFLFVGCVFGFGFVGFDDGGVSLGFIVCIVFVGCCVGCWFDGIFGFVCYL